MVDLTNIRSFLQGSPPLCRDGWLDVTAIKIAASLLPDHLPVNDDSCKVLDELWAIVFHHQFPLRVQTAEDWVDEHYVPTKEVKSTAEDKSKALDLLQSIGLGQSSTPSPPIRRL